MNKILRLLVDDFLSRKPSAEYLLVLKNCCDAEKAFMALLDEKQKAEFFKIDALNGELAVSGLNELVKFLYKSLIQE
ncbi:MAG: hypothetical protein FWE16_02325 [Firmicutes bacterium]|nr:hypothetical protein [Bacillota bacterium]